jgi:hypothetical protein
VRMTIFMRNTKVALIAGLGKLSEDFNDASILALGRPTFFTCLHKPETC